MKKVYIWLFAAFPFHSIAEERDYFSLSIDELLDIQIIETASGYEQKIKDSPASASVILREEWEAMGATDLYEALSSVAGVHVGLDTSILETSTIIIRGLGSTGTQVKVLVDGIPFNDRTRAEVKSVGRLPLHGFERIEIVRGPGSVLHGADAFAGTINLVSEPAGSETNNRVFMGAGKDKLRGGSFSYGGEYKGINWYVSAQLESSGNTGRRVEVDAQTFLDLAPFSGLTPPASHAPGPLQDWYDVENIIVKANHDNLSAEILNWQLTSGMHLGVTDRIDNPNNPVSQVKQTQRSVKLNYVPDVSVPGTLELELLYDYSYEDNDFMVFPAGSVVLVGDDGNLFSAGAYPAVLIDDGLFTHTGMNNETISFKVNHIFVTHDVHQIRWEAGYENNELDAEFIRMFGPGVTDAITLPRPTDGSPLFLGQRGSGVDVSDSAENRFILPSSRNFSFIAFQDEWQVSDRFNLVLGIRVDDYSDFGTTTNPRVGFNWQVNNDLTMKLFNGSAFRAPSFGELYSQNNTVVDGNENLKPETINTWEMSFYLDSLFDGMLSLNSTFYRFETKGVIRDLFNASTNKLLSQNATGEIGEGLEFETIWKPTSEVTVKASYAKTSLKNSETDLNVANIPSELMYVNANWKIDANLNLNLGVKQVSGRKRASGDDRSPTENFTQVMSKIAWHNVIDGLTLSLSGSNLLDDYISEPGPSFLENDLPLGGPIYKFEMTYQF